MPRMSFTANPSEAESLESSTAQLLEAPPQLRVDGGFLSETSQTLGQGSLHCPKQTALTYVLSTFYPGPLIL